MKKSLILVLLQFSLISLCSAQHINSLFTQVSLSAQDSLSIKPTQLKSPKNKIAISYTTQWSRTFFSKNILKESDYQFRELALKEPPSQLHLNHGYGVNYLRLINSVLGIGVDLNYRKYGQQSVTSLGFTEVNVEKLKILTTSYEAALNFRYKLHENNKFKLAISAAPIFSIYHRAWAKTFKYESAFKRVEGCCTIKYLHATGGLVKELKRHVEIGLWRIGISSGVEIEYPILSNFYFSGAASLNVYSGFFLKEISSHIADNWIFSLNFDIGLGYNF
ncbi:MAG: hypothetical protein IPN76_16440 [Saprospiraceae bacterium]|nr:hypothetical protein [Saprospiraceae bacterium]